MLEPSAAARPFGGRSGFLSHVGRAAGVSESEGRRGCGTWSGRGLCDTSYPSGRAPGVKLISAVGARAASYRLVPVGHVRHESDRLHLPPDDCLDGVLEFVQCLKVLAGQQAPWHPPLYLDGVQLRRVRRQEYQLMFPFVDSTNMFTVSDLYEAVSSIGTNLAYIVSRYLRKSLNVSEFRDSATRMR